jgi:hypothetical protein
MLTHSINFGQHAVPLSSQLHNKNKFLKNAHNNIIKKERKDEEKVTGKNMKEKQCMRLLCYFVCASASEWMNLGRFLVASR